MPSWGNPILQKLLNGLEKQRIKAAQETMRLAKKRPQGASPERNHARLQSFVGNGMQLSPTASFDEMFIAAALTQRFDAAQRAQTAQQREEAAHPEFYKGRSKRPLPW